MLAFFLVAITACSTPDLAMQQTQVALQQTQVALQQTQTAFPVATTAPSENPNSGIIPFGSQSDPNLLNPALGWQPGGVQSNNYDLTLYSGALTLIAGPYSWQEQNGLPMIIYPYKGDFETQVKMKVNFPQASLSGNAHSAALAIRPIGEQNPHLWIINLRTVDGYGHQVLSGVYESHWESVKYSDDEIYMKIERHGDLFNSAYSTNNANWVPMLKDFVFHMPDDVEILLFLYSTDGEGVTAQFYDFGVVSR